MAKSNNTSINTDNKETISRVTHKGILKILDKELPCAVLEDGTRILTKTAIFTAFGRTHADNNINSTKQFNLPSFVRSNNLLPYITQEIQDKFKMIHYIDTKSRKTRGYSAELIPVICDIYLHARREKVLHKSQERLAVVAEMISASLAKVGIAALIDEATGYQGVRPKDALKALLDKYLSEKFSQWAKKFPDDFYIQMFRLKGWDINKDYFSRRTQFVGKITNDIVYSRLAPEIVEELQKLNPKDPRGRKRKHHQHLSAELGHPELSGHIGKIVTLMKAAISWEEFQKMINRALPILNKESFLEELQKSSG
ncbi:MAG: P63C domain-containing protein [Silvanigrellaceae bacterium]|nr:P63C domain-containing protein [Silvanigrellaceae bacterium]